MGKYGETSKAYTLKYIKEKLDEIKIRAPKGTKERYKQAASDAGTSLNKFCIDAIEKHIKDNKK